MKHGRSPGQQASSIVTAPVLERPAPQSVPRLPRNDRGRRIVTGYPVQPRTRSVGSPALTALADHSPSKGNTSQAPTPGIHSSVPVIDDLAYVNRGPETAIQQWVPQRPDEWEKIEARVRHTVRVQDDFVQVPFIRLASTSERQIAQAVESYKREAAIVDARLSHEVTCAFKATALSDLCDQLRSETGIQLAGGPSVADEKVTLFCEKPPLREVMRQISRPFGYAWLRSGKPGEYRYELAQDLKSQLLEEELRNRDRNEALIALDREMNRFRKYLELSPDEALARARTAGPEEKKLLERYASGGWGLIRLYFRLSPAEMTALRAGKELKYGQPPRKVPDKEDWQPLPADLERGILQSWRDRRLIVQEGKYRLVPARDHPDGLPLAAVPGARAMLMLHMPQSELGKFTLAGGRGSFISDDSPIPGSFSQISRVDVAQGVSPAVLDPKNAVANAPLSRDPALRASITVRPEASLGNLSPSTRSAGTRSPARGGEPRTATGYRHPSPRRGGGAPPRSGGPGDVVSGEAKVTSADVLEALHRATGLPVVADYYTRLHAPGAVSVKALPLFEALNQLSDAMHLRWNKDERWLQFRSAGYFNDRLKEVPNRLLARWSAARRQHGAATLDDLIEMGQLADAQLNAESMAEGAKECWGLAEWDLARYAILRPHLRYLAGFTPEQRQMAMGPAGLPFTRLSLSQQQQFITLFTPPGDTRLQSLEDLARAAVWVAYTQPGWFQWERPGWSQHLLSPVREQTREAALQAALRIDSQATTEQIIPSRLDLIVLYTQQGGDPGYGRTVNSTHGDSWWGGRSKGGYRAAPVK
jgi:hypothetical protein